VRRLAVTGASGFVGRQLVSLAYAERWEVHGVVRSADSGGRVKGAGGQAHLVESLKADALVPVFAGAEAVVHLAMIGSEKDGATYNSVNVEGTRHVAEAAQRAGVPRVVMFSGLGVARYGLAPRTTNRYFLSKLQAELELFRAGGEAVALRPSYIVGPGDGLVTNLLQQMRAGAVEIPGDGSYRLQPVAVKDAAAAILAAVAAPLSAEPPRPRHRVYDLVGPEPMAYAAFVDAVGEVAGRLKRVGPWERRTVDVAEADARAREGAYQGMPPDELDCLLCDEVSDRRPLEALLGRFLVPAAEAIEQAVRGTRLA
jgi:NADH dehydrogenase